MTQLIAHRGVSFEAPENTLAAFQLAIDMGVDCIEMDLHLTSDGVPVVIHDSSLKRTTNASGDFSIEELTLEQAKELDAGSWFSSEFAGEKIPTLKEVLALQRKGVKLMLEIKKGTVAPAKLCSAILSCLPKNDPTIILGSFEPDIVKALLDSSYQLIGIVEEESFIEVFLEMGLKHLAVWSKILGVRLMETSAEHQARVWVFTVDDPEDARFLNSLRVDGIITNNPRILQSEIL